MSQRVTIKCPYCSAKLKIAAMPDKIERVFVNCPICKHKSPLSDFEIVMTEQPQVSNTNMPQKNNDATLMESEVRRTNSDDTVIGTNEQRRGVVGSLVMPDGSLVKLHVGVNTIGRRAQASQSEIQFADINGSKKASRHHARIEVMPQSSGMYLHTLSNWENKNGTTINGVKLNSGDTVVLHDGDQIWCGDVPLRFVIVDCSDSLPQENTGA